MTHPPHLANRNTAVQDGFLGYLDGILRNREDYFAGIFEGRAIGKNLAYLFIIVIGLSAFYG
ncbi:MAG: hypothetical protein KC940_22645, partial [Candidatus Omnitrophica bacterium]|nr:hypothetical protein [Candidatus Omnitrophota bacterium]